MGGLLYIHLERAFPAVRYFRLMKMNIVFRKKVFYTTAQDADIFPKCSFSRYNTHVIVI